MIECIKNHGEIIWYESDLSNHAQAQHAFDIDYCKSNGKIIGCAQGRGTTWFIRLGDQTEVALRHYYRGGLIGRILSDQFVFRSWESSRGIQELKVLETLQHAGVNVPAPFAARAVRKGLYYSCDIITTLIKDAKDLASVLVNNLIEHETYSKIGQEIKKMHLAQVNHSDLNIHNIMLDANAKVWLIDFDKSRIEDASYQGSGNHWQQSNLARLKRSFLKELRKRNIHWDESRDWQSLLDGYNAE